METKIGAKEVFRRKDPGPSVENILENPNAKRNATEIIRRVGEVSCRMQAGEITPREAIIMTFNYFQGINSMAQRPTRK